MAVAFTFLVGRVGKSLFFGQLRDVEIELVIEKSKYTITETCLALTIFRAELDLSVLSLFGLLLFLKIFHWLSHSRIDYLEQLNPVPVKTHLRLVSLLLSLLALDGILAYHCLNHTMKKGKSVLILFGFEFGLLIISILNLSSRYGLFVVDNCRPNGLSSKGLLVMLADLLCDALRFGIYCLFFILVFTNYGLPLHIIRELWMAFYNFQRRLSSFLKYLKLTQNLASRFPDATEHELLACRDCLICREDMIAGKKLPCNHVFHIDCLRMWLQHQQTCPLCRAEIPTTAAPTPPVAANQANNGAAAAAAAAAAEPNFFMGAQDVNVNVQNNDANLHMNSPAVAAPNDNPVPPAASAAGDASPIAQSSYSPADISEIKNRAKAYNSMGFAASSSSHGADPPLPAFFVVCAAELPVMETADDNSKIVRRIKRGVVVFVTDIVFRPDSSSDRTRWYRLADGAVCCSAEGIVPIDVSKAVGVLSNSATVYDDLLPSPVGAEGSGGQTPNSMTRQSGIMSGIKNRRTSRSGGSTADFSFASDDSDIDSGSDEEREGLLLGHSRGYMQEMAHMSDAQQADRPLVGRSFDSAQSRGLDAFVLLSKKLTRISADLTKMNRSVDKYSSLVNSMIVERSRSANVSLESSPSTNVSNINISSSSFAADTDAFVASDSSERREDCEADDLSISMTSVSSPAKEGDAEAERAKRDANADSAPVSPLASNFDDKSHSPAAEPSEKEALRLRRLRYLSTSGGGAGSDR